MKIVSYAEFLTRRFPPNKKTIPPPLRGVKATLDALKFNPEAVVSLWRFAKLEPSHKRWMRECLSGQYFYDQMGRLFFELDSDAVLFYLQYKDELFNP